MMIFVAMLVFDVRRLSSKAIARQILNVPTRTGRDEAVDNPHEIAGNNLAVEIVSIRFSSDVGSHLFSLPEVDLNWSQ